MLSDDDLTEIRRSRPWRVGVWGLRLELRALILVVLGSVNFALGAPTTGAAVLTAGLVVLVVGVVVGLTAMTSVRKTAQESGVPSGDPSEGTMAALGRALVADVAARRARPS